MNTNGLAKHYDLLTPRERLPLIMAAALRGDGAEFDRLHRSAPRLGYSVPDYYPFSEALLRTSLSHLQRRFDAVMVFLKVQAVVLTDDEGDERFWKLMRATAYAVTLEADGWTQFCEAMRLDPECLLGGLEARDLLKMVEDNARDLAYTAEEALAYRREGGSCAGVRTPSVVAAELRKIFDAQKATWK